VSVRLGEITSAASASRICGADMPVRLRKVPVPNFNSLMLFASGFKPETKPERSPQAKKGNFLLY
jgi:hypothetical protein